MGTLIPYLLYACLFMFALSGLILMGALTKLSRAERILDETSKLAVRALLLRKKR